MIIQAVSYKAKPLITFRITGMGVPLSYQAEAGMTWAQWCGSSYNTDGWVVRGNSIRDKTDYYTVYNTRDIYGYTPAASLIVADKDYIGIRDGEPL